MLEVCASVAVADGRVSLASLLEDPDLSASVYAGPLKKLAELGLLLDAPLPGDGHRERWYVPTESQLWGAALQLADLTDGRSS